MHSTVPCRPRQPCCRSVPPATSAAAHLPEQRQAYKPFKLYPTRSLHSNVPDKIIYDTSDMITWAGLPLECDETRFCLQVDGCPHKHTMHEPAFSVSSSVTSRRRSWPSRMVLRNCVLPYTVGQNQKRVGNARKSRTAADSDEPTAKS